MCLAPNWRKCLAQVFPSTMIKLIMRWWRDHLMPHQFYRFVTGFHKTKTYFSPSLLFPSWQASYMKPIIFYYWLQYFYGSIFCVTNLCSMPQLVPVFPFLIKYTPINFSMFSFYQLQIKNFFFFFIIVLIFAWISSSCILILFHSPGCLSFFW